MTREIKFRAWHTKTNKIVDLQRLSTFAVEGGLKGLYLPTDDETLILMQFTGLKDKNGVEIYEGDILLYRKIIEKMSMPDSNGIYHVKKRKNPKEELHYWQVFFTEKGQWQGKRKIDLGAEHSQALWQMVENHEVIGNIYQNPELLSAK